MIVDIKRLADKILPFGTAEAHCDIPCGIYDPRDAIHDFDEPSLFEHALSRAYIVAAASDHSLERSELFCGFGGSL